MKCAFNKNFTGIFATLLYLKNNIFSNLVTKGILVISRKPHLHYKDIINNNNEILKLSNFHARFHKN